MKKVKLFSTSIFTITAAFLLSACGNQGNVNPATYNQQGLNNGYGYNYNGWGYGGYGICNGGQAIPMSNGTYRCQIPVIPAQGYAQGGYYTASGTVQAGDTVRFNLNGVQVQSGGLGCGGNGFLWPWQVPGAMQGNTSVLMPNNFSIQTPQGNLSGYQVGQPIVMQTSGTIVLQASVPSQGQCGASLMFPGGGAVVVERCVSQNGQAVACQ